MSKEDIDTMLVMGHDLQTLVFHFLMIKQRFPAHVELGLCGTSLVFPKRSVFQLVDANKTGL